jgi:hypothetical protein
VLTGPGSIDGFDGNASVVQAFANIDLLSGSGDDTLTGANLDAVWTLDAATSYHVGGADLLFSGFSRLYGGSAADAFEFWNAAVFAGSLNGGAGPDSMDYGSYAAPVSVNLQTAAATGLTGTWGGIEALAGGPLVDAFTGQDLASTFELDGSDRYFNAALSLDLSDFEILVGGGAADTFQVQASLTYDLLGGGGNDGFVLADGVILTGLVDGGAGANTLDLSAFGLPRAALLLGAGGLAGFDGLEASLTGGFQNITTLLAPLGPADGLQGADLNAVWSFGSVNKVQASGRTLQFSGFDLYTGGTGGDTFALADGATIPGIVDAAGGNDTLDLSAYRTDVYVDLETGEATGIRGGLPGSALNFEHVRGGSGNDILIGNDLDNVLAGGPGDDRLYGQGGNDTLKTWTGHDTLYGGDGYDTGVIHYSASYLVPLDDVENLFFLTPPPAPPAPSPLTLLVVVLDLESEQEAGLICSDCVGFILRLLEEPNGQVYLGKGIGASASLESLGIDEVEELPAPFDDRYHLVEGLRIEVYDTAGERLSDLDSYIRVTYPVPLWLLAHDLFVFHWDEGANEGRGAWILLDLDVVDPASGLVSVYAKRTGLYLLVVRAEEVSLDCTGRAAATMPNGDVVGAACVEGAALWIWPVVPWLLPAEYRAEFQVGWATRAVDAPEGVTVAVSVSFGLEQDQLGLPVAVMEEAAPEWVVVASSLQDGRVAVSSPEPRVFILIIGQ